MWVAIKSSRIQLLTQLGRTLSVNFPTRSVYHGGSFLVRADRVPLASWVEVIGTDAASTTSRIYFGHDISRAYQLGDAWVEAEQGRSMEVREAPMIEPMSFILGTFGDRVELVPGKGMSSKLLLAFGADGFENAPSVVQRPGIQVLGCALGIPGDGKFAIEVLAVLDDGAALEIVDRMTMNPVKKVVVRADLSSRELVEVFPAR